MALEDAGGTISRLLVFLQTDEALSAALLVAVEALVAGFAAVAHFEFKPAVDEYTYATGRDMMLIVFLGFGFLATYLKRFGVSSVGYCLLLGAVVVQLSFVAEYSLNMGSRELTFDNIVRGLFCAVAVLVSFGAVAGKASPFQLVLMAIAEVFAFWMNYRWVITELGAHDVGGGIFVFLFGACFGLAATWWFSHRPSFEHYREGASRFSNMISLAGTVMLWVLWTSLASARAASEARRVLAVINTILSLCSSTIAFGAVSRIINRHHFCVAHLQRATLAGGVAIAVIADTDIGAYGAMLVGTVAGTLSCVLFTFVHPLLRKLNLHDTLGVAFVFGVPALLAAVTSFVAFAKFEDTAVDRAGLDKTKGFTGTNVDEQVIATLITAGWATGVGFVVGFGAYWPFRNMGLSLPQADYYSDSPFFAEAKAEITI